MKTPGWLLVAGLTMLGASQLSAGEQAVTVW
jgi:hypothetical protein